MRISNERASMRSWHPITSALQRAVVLFVLLIAAPFPVHAAGSPWEDAVNVLQAAFTGPIARGLSLVAIVVGGLMFAYNESDSKRMLAGIIFGVGMAVAAPSFMTWLFP